MPSKIKFTIPFVFAFIFSFFFYHQFFTKHLIPAPLDIVPGMYLPWLDQRRDIFPNGGPVKNPLPSDVVSLTLPLRKIVIDSFKNKQWPLWNRFILSGTPLLDNFQSAAFNPLNIFYFLPIDFINIWAVQVILQSFFAFIAFFIFINQFNLKLFSKIISSFFWAFNGFFIIWFQYNTVVYAVVFLPLILFCIDKIKQNYLYGFLLSLLLTFSVFSGNPPMTLIAFGTTLIYSIFTYWKNSKYIFVSILFLLLSLLYSSPQLLSGFDTSTTSIRNNDTIASSQNIKFIIPIKLLTIVTPDFFGHPSTRNTWKDYPLYDNTTIYNGILPIILFLLSFKIWKKFDSRKQKIWWFSMIISSIAFIAMVKSPISEFFGNLNFFGLSSMVFTRFSVLWSLALAIISGLTLDSIQNHQIKFKDFISSFLLSFIAIVIPTAVTFFFKYFPSSIANDYDLIVQNETAFRNCFYPMVFILGNIALISLYSLCKNKTLQKIFLISILSLSIFDIYRFFNKYNSFTSKNDFYPKSELTDFLSQNSFRFIRESSELIPSNMWLMYPNLQTPSGYDTTYSQNYGQFISFINTGDLSKTTNRYLEIDNLNSPLVDLLSSDYFVVTKKSQYRLDVGGSIPLTLNQNRKIAKDMGDFVIIKNNKSLPFIYPIKNTKLVSNTQETANLFKQIDIHQTALVSDSSVELNQLNNQIKIDQINIQNQKIEFNTIDNSHQQLPSFLVISQTFNKNWKLAIDNIPSKTYLTNHAFTGILVPSGNHQIKLVYHPDLFYLSLKIALYSMILSLLLIVIKAVTHRFQKKISVKSR